MTLSVCPGRFWKSRNAWWGASSCRCWRRSTTRNVRCWNSCGVRPRDWRRSSVTCTISRAKSDHCSRADTQVDGKPARAHFVPFRQQTGFHWIPFALASAGRCPAIVFSKCRGVSRFEVWSLLCFRGGTVSLYVIWKIYVVMKSSKCATLMCVGAHSKLAVIYILIYIEIYIYLLLLCGLNLFKVLLWFFCCFESKCNPKVASGQDRFLLCTCTFHAASIISFQNPLQKVFLCHIKDSIHFLRYHYHKFPIYHLS